ncbi:MAG: hypothetical protein P4M13_08740 [Alphaproteobacteria bacterium]|nr:hypothetical protein [Alphaproteobacteria bacterium]
MQFFFGFVAALDIIQNLGQQVVGQRKGMQNIPDLLHNDVLLDPQDIVFIGGVARHQIDITSLLQRTGDFPPRCGAGYQTAQDERIAGLSDGLLRHIGAAFALLACPENIVLDKLRIGMRVEMPFNPHQAAIEWIAENIRYRLQTQRLVLAAQQAPFLRLAAEFGHRGHASPVFVEKPLD